MPEEKGLMRGTTVMAEAAISKAGCRFFAGYPITPQNELPEYASWRMPQVGGTFIETESELAAANMLYGAGAAGARVMTSSSGPGISLMQEAISLMAGAEIPCVIINVQRTGPGPGSFDPCQADYFQAVKGGGNGDYHTIVLAPASLQEAATLIVDAFDIADKYRNPVLVLCDLLLGNMKEPVDWEKVRISKPPEKPWALTGKKGRSKNEIRSDPVPMGQRIKKIFAKYKKILDEEPRYETINLEQAEVVIVAFGMMARIAKATVSEGKKRKISIGLIRPITLWPFPTKPFTEAASKVKFFLVVEMNMGQMVEDVRLTVNGKRPVYFFGRSGDRPYTSVEIADEIQRLISLEGKRKW